jgi:hypothetical protein
MSRFRLPKVARDLLSVRASVWCRGGSPCGFRVRAALGEDHPTTGFWFWAADYFLTTADFHDVALSLALDGQPAATPGHELPVMRRVGRVRVEVTAEDIAKGVPERPCFCPVARALRRVGVEPSVNGWWLDLRCSIPTPADVVTFMGAFDNERPVEPFAFDIELPDAADAVVRGGNQPWTKETT